MNKFGHRCKDNESVHDKSLTTCCFIGKIGHLSSQCKILPKKIMFKAHKTSNKRPKKIWVPKQKIIYVVNMLDSRKETLIMVPGQWLLMTHDMRKVYVPKPNPY